MEKVFETRETSLKILEDRFMENKNTNENGFEITNMEEKKNNKINEKFKKVKVSKKKEKMELVANLKLAEDSSS